MCAFSRHEDNEKVTPRLNFYCNYRVEETLIYSSIYMYISINL